ncbi:DUF4843 domain-containing protein [Sphingobacterium tabacisoli]|uniref:DUF4843 domain-containing protein n=1 Tax=Sphingobacterium tabacisoli TaxID=2044855 RepID=A0ABW5L675_9SPHI|nr:DUF4843 domain-containing protein [Sphingobacterium tabacisoli]
MNLVYKVITGTLLTVGISVLSSCEKDIDGYVQDARVYFFERSNDLNQTRISNRSFTFLTVPEQQMKDTLYIKVKTMGEVSAVDRYPIAKTVAEGSTATEGIDYEFIPGLVAANQIEGNVAVVLHRTARLKNETVLLNLAIGESADFKGGVTEDGTFTLRWSDRLVQPDTWPFYFGTYSDVKYQFIIDHLGIADYPHQLSPRIEAQPGEYSIADLQDMASRLRIILREENAANEGKPGYPLRDENGALVVF